MTASETVNPKEKLGGPLGRAEERHRPGSMGATSPPRPRPASLPWAVWTRMGAGVRRAALEGLG